MKKLLTLLNIYKNYLKFVNKKDIRFFIFINPLLLLFLAPVFILISLINLNFITTCLLKYNILQFGIRFFTFNKILQIQKNSYYNEKIILNTDYNKNLVELKTNGQTVFKEFFNSEDEDDLLEILHGQKSYNSQTLLQSNGKPVIFNKNFANKEMEAHSYLYFLPEVSLKYHKLKKFLLNHKFINFLNSYLGYRGTFYNVSTWFNKPSKKKLIVHDYHRDFDDFKQLAVSICWNDINEINGSTIFIPGSHINPNINVKNQEPQILSLQAGDVVVSDVLGLHSANSLKDGYRLITWCKFGKKNNAATVTDGNLSNPNNLLNN